MVPFFTDAREVPCNSLERGSRKTMLLNIILKRKETDHVDEGDENSGGAFNRDRYNQRLDCDVLRYHEFAMVTHKVYRVIP